MTGRYTLYGAKLSGPTYKVALMLALCGEDFAYRHMDMKSGAHKQPSYLALNRFGQVPCLVDRSNGRQLSQSAAILEYLADRTGRFGGATLEERLTVREWMFWDFDRLAPGVYRTRAARIGVRPQLPDVVAYFENEAHLALKVLDQALTGRQWLVGEAPTIADIDVYGVVSLAPEGQFDMSPYAAVQAWSRRLEELPGFGSRADLLPGEDRG